MENNVFCKTRISNPKKIWYNVCIAIAIVSLIVMILSIIPVRQEKHYERFWEGDCIDYCNMFGERLKIEYPDGDITRELESFGDYFSYLFFDFHFCNIASYALILSILLMIGYALVRSSCKKCTLELNQDGVYGKKKTLFSLKSINQPFEKIDNVSIRDSIIDKILGGRTLVIRSSSSCIKFSCVDNAQEFLDKTLEELKKYKEAVNSKSEKATKASSDGDTMEAIVKLKNLLDQGLITQEEFDAKRKALIDKI